MKSFKLKLIGVVADTVKSMNPKAIGAAAVAVALFVSAMSALTSAHAAAAKTSEPPIVYADKSPAKVYPKKAAAVKTAAKPVLKGTVQK